MTGRVLIVDDEAPLRHTLDVNLVARGYQVDQAATGAEALGVAERSAPDLVMLDLGLPDMDGIEVVRALRARSDVPIVVLSARGGEAARVAALEVGADDYVTKPFGMDELLGRVRAALRRVGPQHGETALETADFSIDLTSRRVSTPAGAEVALTATQWRLVDVLVRSQGRLVGQRQLHAEVWGDAGTGEGHDLRVVMAQLRRKLEPDPARPRHFVTAPGIGYRLVG